MLTERLNSLTKDQLIALREVLNNGRVGFDAARVSKGDLISRILLDHSPLDIERQLGIAAAPVAATAPAANNAADMIARAVALIASQSAPAPAIDADAVRALIDERLAASPVVRLEVTRGDGSTWVAPTGSRPEFARVLRAATAGLNVLLVGPAGCGKTTLAHQVADALARPFASVSCTAGMSESEFKGWLIPGEGGRFEYLESDFVRMYEQGGVFLFDEFDAADPNVLLFVNQALANGSFFLPIRKGATRVQRHPDFVCIAAANTYGTGANMTYSGRERLDEATLDRFRAATIALDYDARLEAANVESELLAWGHAVRERIRANRLQRVMSTRFLLDATRLMRAGASSDEVRETYFTGWKADERAKVEG